ncbi:DCL family protein [Pseudomonas sp. SWRI59]|uniref:DCL family protein n=1 Tax=unclassified Pseudomonas TaxID=196821 RepID=UPI00164675F1|nr:MULTISPECIES: DCL family protein [unclassified Pseudomonas]MBC3503536.1 DCL family protein [Pseudomonas sp. SWRI59]MBC3507493.1 DCL family protein [Pseudomonas sp. SWRI68]
MAAKPIVLPSKLFRTKGEAEQFFSAMLGRYNNGDRVSSDDEVLLYEYFLRNPEAQEKTGPGIEFFFKDKSPDHSTSCFHIFWVRSVDNRQSTDFGLKACRDAKGPTVAGSFYSACRHAVDAGLTAKKRAIYDSSGGVVPCSVTGVDTTFTTSEYRHTEPRFQNIVRDFIALRGLEVTASLMTPGQNNQYVTKFIDPLMEQDFIQYHGSVAKLAIFAK